MAKLQRATFPHPPSSIYVCEICGVEVSDVEVKSYMLSIALPGKNGVIGSINCKAGQHFGCCEAHAWEAAVACHDEHLAPEHDALHAAVENDPEKFVQVVKLRATQRERPAWQLRQPSTAGT